MGTILIIKLSALGDLAQADGAVRDIREHHRGDTLIAMTTPPYRRFMERCPWVDGVFVDPRAPRFHVGAMLELRRRVRQLPIDRVYDLQQVGRTRFYRRVVFPPVEWVGDAPGCTVHLCRDPAACAADHFARHLGKAGLRTTHTQACDLSWLAGDVEAVLARYGLRPGYVLLTPGVSKSHEAKRWPHFAALAERLIARGKRVVTVPGPAEVEAFRAIGGDMLTGADGVLDYVTLAGIASRAAYVIGNDTGPTHIAAHLGCRGLALYGAHTPASTTGIQHTRFSWLEVADLSALTVDRVWGRVETELLVAG